MYHVVKGFQRRFGKPLSVLAKRSRFSLQLPKVLKIKKFCVVLRIYVTIHHRCGSIEVSGEVDTRPMRYTWHGKRLAFQSFLLRVYLSGIYRNKSHNFLL